MTRSAQPIRQVLKAVLKEIKTPHRQQQQALVQEWKEIIGERFASATRLVGVKQNILQVEVGSSVLLYELAHFHKPHILQRIKTKYPASNFRDINFFVGSR